MSQGRNSNSGFQDTLWNTSVMNKSASAEDKDGEAEVMLDDTKSYL